MTRKPDPQPSAGGSYVLDAKGKLQRKEFTAPAPGRGQRRRLASGETVPVPGVDENRPADEAGSKRRGGPQARQGG